MASFSVADGHSNYPLSLNDEQMEGKKKMKKKAMSKTQQDNVEGEEP